MEKELATFTFTFTFTFTNWRGASSRSIERHFLFIFSLFWNWNHIDNKRIRPTRAMHCLRGGEGYMIWNFEKYWLLFFTDEYFPPGFFCIFGIRRPCWRGQCEKLLPWDCRLLFHRWIEDQHWAWASFLLFWRRSKNGRFYNTYNIYFSHFHLWSRDEGKWSHV